MRKLSGNVLRTFVATGLAAVATASVARADERIVARVPFDFVVGDSRLPAGPYVVTNVSNDPGVDVDRERRWPSLRVYPDDSFVVHPDARAAGARVRKIRERVRSRSS